MDTIMNDSEKCLKLQSNLLSLLFTLCNSWLLWILNYFLFQLFLSVEMQKERGTGGGTGGGGGAENRREAGKEADGRRWVFLIVPWVIDMQGGCVTSCQCYISTGILNIVTRACLYWATVTIYQDITTVIQISDIMLTLLLFVCWSDQLDKLCASLYK